MIQAAVPSTPAENAPASSTATRRLHGRALLIARSIWGLVALIDLGVLVVGFPAYAAQLNTFCTDTTLVSCGPLQLVPGQQAALQQAGVSLASYALGVFALDVLVTLLFVGIGVLIFWHTSRERMGLFVSLFLITYGSFGLDGTHVAGLQAVPWLALAAFPLFFLQWPAQGLLFYAFPDGRFVPRWSWGLAFLFVIQVGFYLLPYPFNLANWPPLLGVLEQLLVYGSAVGTQVYRYIAVASPIQRQQIKWLAFSFTLALLLFAFFSLLPLVFPALIRPSSLYQLTAPVLVLLLGYVPIALGIAIALLRYRLWDIDTLINKALVYGSLTVLLGALYAGLIVGLEGLAALITGQTSDPVALVISTLAIAALFQPVRQRIQALIDRRFYRKKYDAEKTLAAFSAALRNEVDLEQVRTHLLVVVNETMQPSLASLWLRQPERPSHASSENHED